MRPEFDLLLLYGAGPTGLLLVLTLAHLGAACAHQLITPLSLN